MEYNAGADLGPSNPLGQWVDYPALEKQFVDFPGLDSDADWWQFDLADFQGLQRRAGVQPKDVVHDRQGACDFTTAVCFYGLADLVVRINYAVGVHMNNPY